MSLGFMSIGRHYNSECTILKHWGKQDGGREAGKGECCVVLLAHSLDTCRWSFYKFANLSLSLSSIPIAGENLLLSDCAHDGAQKIK